MNQQAPERTRPSEEVVLANVRAALAEDVGSGDITAALIPATETARGRVITRENGVLCGRAWVDRVFTELDASIVLDWQAAGIKTLSLIGDAAAPGPIAWATYAGRRFAEELDMPDDRGDTPAFRREVAALEPLPSRLPA